MTQGLERAIEGVPAPKSEPNYDSLYVTGGVLLTFAIAGVIAYKIVKKKLGYNSIHDTNLYPPTDSHKEKHY